MSYHYILHESAQEDYEVALRWYAERSLKATENFIIAVDDTLSLICDHPVRWRNEYKFFYELGVKKYPYTIIYTIDPDQKLIIVISIYHHKRNPRKKYRK
jgi:plasmid stabilization system protein ParE